jgi:hypothetical protein
MCRQKGFAYPGLLVILIILLFIGLIFKNQLFKAKEVQLPGKIAFLRATLGDGGGYQTTLQAYDFSSKKAVIIDNNRPINYLWSPTESKLLSHGVEGTRNDAEKNPLVQTEGGVLRLVDVTKYVQDPNSEGFNIELTQPDKDSSLGSISNDGKKIAFWRSYLVKSDQEPYFKGKYELVIKDLSSKVESVLLNSEKTTTPDPKLTYFNISYIPLWSPDDTRLLLYVGQDMYTNSGHIPVLIDIHSTHISFLPDESGSVHTLALSNGDFQWLTNDELIFNKNIFEDYKSEGLYKYSVTTKSIVQITNRGWYMPILSPDKKKVALNVGIGTYEPKSQAINIVDIGKGQTWPQKSDENDTKYIQTSSDLAVLPANYKFPQKVLGIPTSWSGDSRYLAVALENSQNQTVDTLILDTKTKKWIILPELQNASQPKWSYH